MLTSSDLKAIKQLLNDGLYPINKEVTKINKKLVEHDKRFGEIDKKLIEHDKRFEKLQDNLDLTIRFFDRDYIKLRRDYDDHTLKFHTI